MKKIITLLFSTSFLLLACNNESKDSVQKADSANKANLDSGNSKQTVATDEETSAFLVKAANGGMAEVQLGQTAEQKATDAGVKKFAAMMVHDHSGANEKVKTLAAQRNVTLPAVVGDDMKKIMDDLSKKTGRDFDKAYVFEMVKDHENDIDLFENAEGKVNDSEVKAFITNTLPTLRMHLDSVKALQKKMK